jgi:DNA-binding Lrp family transcriptional regulator
MKLVKVTESHLQLDATDVAILQTLREDARATMKKIGEASGLSAPAACRRLAKLEEGGVIAGYTVRLNQPFDLQLKVMAQKGLAA